jgi:CRP/FNR family cyclic AMP-dependent transcriptional regulator
MAELGILKTFASHPFLSGLADQHLMLLASGASPFTAEPDEFLGRAGEPAHALYLIQSGCVTIGVHKPDSEITPLRTAGPGEAVGWSWLVPPHTWHFDFCAVDRVQGLLFNATWLREQCEQRHELGYHFLNRYVAVLTSHLAALRTQFPDLDWHLRGIE